MNRGEEFKDDFRKALPKELVQALSRVSFARSAWSVLQEALVLGALIAVATLGEASPAMEGMVALLGGTVAAGSHLTKTSTRAAANTSPEPFSNWILSLGEDLFVVGLGFLALQYPVVALGVVALLLALVAVFAVVIVRTVRRWFARTPAIERR